MNNFWKITIATGVITAAYLIRKQVQLLYAYSFKLRKVKTGVVSVEKLELTFTIELFNKSSIGYEITGYDFDVFLNNTLVAKVKNQDQQKRMVKPHSSALIDVKVVTSPKKVFNADNVASLLSILNPQKLMVRLKGVVSAKAGILNVTAIPVDFSDSLANIIKPKEETTT